MIYIIVKLAVLIPIPSHQMRHVIQMLHKVCHFTSDIWRWVLDHRLRVRIHWKLVAVTQLLTSACNLQSFILPRYVVSLLQQGSYTSPCHRYMQSQFFDCAVTILMKLSGKGLWGLTLLNQILSTTSTHTQWETKAWFHKYFRGGTLIHYITSMDYKICHHSSW